MQAHFLFPANHPVLCDAGHACEQAAVQHPRTSRWFVTFGHCGFNSAANNSIGFATKAQAVASIRRCQRPGFTAKVEA